MTESLKYLHDVQFLSFPSLDGALTVFEGDQNIPFEIARTFVAHAPGGSSRGFHAHRKCLQLLVCLHGSIDVIIDDGREKQKISLENPAQGVLIPPTLWAEQNYSAENNILMVLCDRRYEREDYIRDRDQYLAFRGVDHLEGSS